MRSPSTLKTDKPACFGKRLSVCDIGCLRCACRKRCAKAYSDRYASLTILAHPYKQDVPEGTADNQASAKFRNRGVDYLVWSHLRLSRDDRRVIYSPFGIKVRWRKGGEYPISGLCSGRFAFGFSRIDARKVVVDFTRFVSADTALKSGAVSLVNKKGVKVWRLELDPKSLNQEWIRSFLPLLQESSQRLRSSR